MRETVCRNPPYFLILLITNTLLKRLKYGGICEQKFFFGKKRQEFLITCQLVNSSTNIMNCALQSFGNMPHHDGRNRISYLFI